ncbi:winged helix-turn-helix domain-containing protein [Streptomyces sp. MBT65]|uniref:BTAD domain-containing putative transcriptional regulator n=1 Tax=Streptomyces sp. MBT65 TaxID=1488395 RepID=UPI00190B6E6D|nr:BTAD domain-containing putative transcriptional regulator [Streptomyces sp. MBT65]MBK3577160.1 winged helix-turn-helix domain-containing protein [Streptomyces sp. MBT65]
MPYSDRSGPGAATRNWRWAPKQRALLALLLTEAGHPVAVHEIVDALWGQDPPDSAVDVVQRHVGALRRLLEPELPAGGESRWLVRGSGGYRLEVGPDDLDLLRFRALRRQAAQDGQPPTATGLLIEALALWRGPAASVIAAEVRSHPAFAALDGEHLAAVKEAAELALEAGPGLGARVLVTLRQAAAQHPLIEEGGNVYLAGVNPKAVGAIRRADGQVQITVGGWPVYRFSGDSKPGDLNGQGVGGTWFAVGPTGEKARS